MEININMKRIIFIIVVIAVYILPGKSGNAQSKNNRRPNVIFILADDLGYGNVSAFNSNSPIKTPNLDDLIANGIKFTRFYSGNTVCAPSRCALMTGKHMGTAYIRGNSKAKDGKGALREQDLTIAELFQDAGYRTGMFGKWGLGDIDSKGAPHLKGYDNFYGYLDQSHAHDYYTDSLYEIKNGVTQLIRVNNKHYTQDLIANKTLEFIKENKENPFFLYVPFTLPHAELIVPDSLIKEFQNADGSSLFEPEKPFAKKGNYDDQAQPHAAFAAMVKKLDTDVGKIVALVKTLGLEDDTYIFFSSDNGPHIEGGADPEYFNSWGKLRGVKRDLYEGGIRVPFIAKIPGKNNKTKEIHDPWAFWDIMPTFSEIAGLNIPQDIDGLSFFPTLIGGNQNKLHDYLYWQFNEKGVLKEAISQGYWKLIRFKEKGKKEILELYNLENDIAEKVDLSQKYPELVKNLYGKILEVKKNPENPTFDWSDMEK